MNWNKILRMRSQAETISGQTNKVLEKAGVSIVVKYRCLKCHKEYEHLADAHVCHDKHNSEERPVIVKTENGIIQLNHPE